MKIYALATTSAVLLLQATSSSAFVAPSPKNRFAVVKVESSQNDRVSPLLAEPKKKDSVTAKPAFAENHAVLRKKWGVDKDGTEDEYWFNPVIHTLGNTGVGGAFHAAMAPLSTYMIDAMAYEGKDIRRKVRMTACLGFVIVVVRNGLLTVSLAPCMIGR